MENSLALNSEIIFRRTYCRPKEDGTFETFEEVIDRVINHQKWLWERAKKSPLLEKELKELNSLKKLMLKRKVSLAGRSLWLGGTELSRTRESSQFNCSGSICSTVYDVVDLFWLLLQGCGVGFYPQNGKLAGFKKPINSIKIIRSKRTEKGGIEKNEEFFEKDTGKWTIKVGDSAESWAKAIGKLLVHKYPAKELVLDFSEVRPAGARLKGYGWISSGDEAVSKSFKAIAEILNKKTGCLLSKIDILDIMNWLGTTLSSRRSAEIALMDFGSDEWETFALAKKNYWLYDKHHRTQSNNSLIFRKKPSRKKLTKVFKMMEEAGGSEPGFINMEAAIKRANFCKTVNPCGEILLPDKGFCCLVELDVSKFKDDSYGIHEALRLLARANYRQTCVELDDGVLQEDWHLNNDFLHLCGVGLTGIVRRPDLKEYDYTSMRRTAITAAYSMATELDYPLPKNITTIKPSGSLSKAVFNTTEGMHKPLGKYIFNNVAFHVKDPLVLVLQEAGYKVFPKPGDLDGILVTLPVKHQDIEFDVVDGMYVNLESAVSQLERYKMLMTYWCDQNVSSTISYSLDEVPAIINWLLKNWDNYVGVSFLYRTDPTKTAKDLGYEYLPQEVVTQEIFEEYISKLKPVDFDKAIKNNFEVEAEECAGGACPIK